MAAKEAILEPSVITGRFRLAHYDVELTSGDSVEVQYESGWHRGGVEFDHSQKAYVVIFANGDSEPLPLIAYHRRLVRVP